MSVVIFPQTKLGGFANETGKDVAVTFSFFGEFKSNSVCLLLSFWFNTVEEAFNVKKVSNVQCAVRWPA